MHSDKNNSFFGKVNHIGFAVRDLETIKSHMLQVYGLEPDRCAVMESSRETRYRGRPADFKLNIIFFKLHNTELEFIQPVSGSSCYTEFLEKHGDGMHHLCYDVEDFEGVRAHMLSSGYEIIQEGPSIRNVPGMRWVYYEKSKSAAHIIEVANYCAFE